MVSELSPKKPQNMTKKQQPFMQWASSQKLAQWSSLPTSNRPTDCLTSTISTSMTTSVFRFVTATPIWLSAWFDPRITDSYLRSRRVFLASTGTQEILKKYSGQKLSRDWCSSSTKIKRKRWEVQLWKASTISSKSSDLLLLTGTCLLWLKPSWNCWKLTLRK